MNSVSLRKKIAKQLKRTAFEWKKGKLCLKYDQFSANNHWNNITQMTTQCSFGHIFKYIIQSLKRTLNCFTLNNNLNRIIYCFKVVLQHLRQAAEKLFNLQCLPWLLVLAIWNRRYFEILSRTATWPWLMVETKKTHIYWFLIFCRLLYETSRLWRLMFSESLE